MTSKVLCTNFVAEHRNEPWNYFELTAAERSAGNLDEWSGITMAMSGKMSWSESDTEYRNGQLQISGRGGGEAPRVPPRTRADIIVPKHDLFNG